MTIPLVNWCPECDETCDDHTTICTMCGTNLTTPPRRQPTLPRNPPLLPTVNEILLAANDVDSQVLIDETGAVNPETPSHGLAELDHLMENLTQRTNSMLQIVQGLLQESSAVANRNGVPQDALNELPRIFLSERSAVLKNAILTIHSERQVETTIDVIPAEFGALQTDLSNRQCIVRDRSVRPNSDDHIKDAILVLRRGEISFAEKARLAQQRGAVGVVIVNDRPSPWPYVMTDSTNRSSDIIIPVVMAPQGTKFPASDEVPKASLRLQNNTDMSCCVCTESFRNTRVIQLPNCGHRFHEACALTWLSSHNSCPYCRSVVYSEPGAATENNNSQEVADAFYG